MRKYGYLITIIVSLVLICTLLNHRINTLTNQLQVYKANNEVLLQDNVQYQTKDSLNAIEAQRLTLTIAEYKRYRADDLKLIESLKTKNRELSRATKTTSQTNVTIKTLVRDSIVYRNKIDTLRCINYQDNWVQLNGCITDGEFCGDISAQDTLVIAETIKYKRFLGFLWRIGIKDIKVDIVSKNPHTKINNAEVILIGTH